MHHLGRLFLLLTIACAACGGDSNDGNGGNPAGPTPPQGPATLQVVDLQLGTGDEANGTKAVQLHYTLWLYDPAGTDGKGARIESSRDRSQPLAFRLGTNAVIPGFEQGVVGTKVGGTRRVTIPPSLAYAPRARDRFLEIRGSCSRSNCSPRRLKGQTTDYRIQRIRVTASTAILLPSSPEELLNGDERSPTEDVQRTPDFTDLADSAI